jgi:tryptophan synthase beta subunit
MSSVYQVNEKGFYGEFGGAFIPEMLFPNVEELKRSYLDILGSAGFKDTFQQLLRDFVGRPTPLYFAERFSQYYKTNIYLKREDLCHTGAHKINNALGQILLARKLNKHRIIAETGAGQHGVATATACAIMGMECVVYMGAKDIERQAPNVARMKILGAKVITVNSGSKTLKDATNEAIRDWINHPKDTHYIIGSVVGPHPYPDLVARLQSVISEEIQKQLDSPPTHIIACVGGGSNAIGAFYHFLENTKVQLIGVEAAGMGIDTNHSAATLALGSTGILHACKTKLLQTHDGQVIEPHSISAGLDYPGIGPQHAYLHKSGRVLYGTATDNEALQAAYLLAKTEGIIPALESAHALAFLEKMDLKPNHRIVINLSGRGDKDLSTLTKHLENDN